MIKLASEGGRMHNGKLLEVARSIDQLGEDIRNKRKTLEWMKKFKTRSPAVLFILEKKMQEMELLLEDTYAMLEKAGCIITDSSPESDEKN